MNTFGSDGTNDAELLLMDCNPVQNDVATQKLPILIAEDEASMRNLVVEALQRDGFSCISVATVAGALEVLNTKQIALLVLDWELDRWGSDVLKAARVDHPKLPVIVMSGRPYDVRTDAIIAEADAFLAKPFSATVITAQVRQLLKHVESGCDFFTPREAQALRPLAEIKDAYIRYAVQLLEGNASLAAKRLGIHRQTVSAALRGTGPHCADLEERPPQT